MSWAAAVLLVASGAIDPCEHARIELSVLARQHFVDPTDEMRSELTPHVALVLDSAARGAIAGDERLTACLPRLIAQARWISDRGGVTETALTTLRGAKPVPYQHYALERALTEPPRPTPAPPAIEDQRTAAARCIQASGECDRKEFDLLKAALRNEQDPRRWAPETVAAFVLATHELRQTASEKKGDLLYEALGSLGSMGYRRALGLLMPNHPALARPGKLDGIGGPKMAHVQDPWAHFFGESELYFSEWEERTTWPLTALPPLERGKRTAELEAHMNGRWDDLDARAPTPDLVQIIKLIEQGHRDRGRLHEK